MERTLDATEDRRRARRLALGFGVLLAAVVGLMTLGALVRAHEAGLACPDWPLCFGRVVPEMDLRVAFEWSHRALAGSISLGFVALAVAALRRPAVARVARPWLLAGALVLAVQILLGALTVWHLLAAWTVTSHLLVGNAFAVILLLTALRLREAAGARRARAPADRTTRLLWGAVAAILLLQVALGGLVSSTFSGMACPEWPTCNGGHWFPAWRGSVGLHLAHRTNAYLVLAGIGLAAWRVRRVSGLAPWAAGTLAVALVQVAVGVANVLLALPVEVTGLHSLLAALLVLATATVTWTAWRGVAAVP
jgi:cytochrome c oxidase assembly protein subunit 15